MGMVLQLYSWYALANVLAGLTFDLHALLRIQETPVSGCKETEVPHSPSEGCERLMTGSADYLSPPIAPPSLFSPCQLQESISNTQRCENDGAK